MIRISGRSRSLILAGVVLLVGIVTASVVLGGHAATRALVPARAAAALDAPIESGLDYTMDSLPSGLRYYVYTHHSASERTELRLVVDVGSVQEGEDQRGLAHAVEHMAFRGTRSFPRGAIERYFEAIGMRRGDDVNGTTSLDDTRFRMTVPTTRAGAIDTALAMLASMAHEATFDSADARREAGVLLEEWRSSRDTDARAGDAWHSLLHAGTPYAARPVLGDTGVLRRIDVAAMRRFYETWYRPELMAVIAVGDFDADEVEAMVRKHFAALPRRGPPSGRPVLPPAVVPSAALRASVVADAERQNSWITVWHPGPRQPFRTRADHRAGLVASLWREVLRGRLQDATFEAGSPLAGSAVERRMLARSASADVVSVTAMRGRALSALEVTVGELKELARNGPTPTELEESAQAILRRERERAGSGDGNGSLAAEFEDHFLTGNAPYTSHTAYELTHDVLPTITVDDVRTFARGRSTDSGAVVVVAATPDDSAASVPPDTVSARVRSARARAPVKSEDVTDVRELLAGAPASGSIVSERAIPEVRAYEWTLSNGMRLLLKPTSFTFDEIRLRAVAPGGASLASDDVYASAYLADVIIGETGIGSIPGPRLKRWLDATSISLSPTVTDDAISLEGTTALADAEAFFRLVHLYLTSPRRDTVAFRRYRERAVSLAHDRGRDPATVFRDSVSSILAGRDPRALTRSPLFYMRTRMDDALDFWTRRAANGAGFTVAIVGDFTLDRVRPLVERYLASVPRGTAEQPRDWRRPPVTGPVRRDIVAGVDAPARVAIGFTAPFELSNENVQSLGAVREVVTRAVSDRLREQLGGTYHVDVWHAIDVVPPARYTMTIEFESAPERVEALTAAAVDELARLHRRGPTEAQFRAVREAQVRDFDGRTEDNAYWVGELTFHARYGWPLAGIVAHPREAEAWTRASLQRACATYIPDRDYVRVTMRPRPMAAAAR